MNGNDNLYIPENEVSILRHVFSQLGFGKSLAKITLPAWFLEHRSVLERFTDWTLHATILRKMNMEELPENRMLHLCAWIISGCHMTPSLPKKPYSSMRGECFRSTLFDHDTEKVIGSYVAEQVTQHPSVCAFHYFDREGNIVVWGNTEMRSKFLLHSVAAIMDNPNTKVNVELLSQNESYTLNFPDMYGRGVIAGPKVMEIVGSVRVHCEKTGIGAKIVFHKKSLSHKYNSINGKIFRIVKINKKKAKKQILIRFQGHWDGKTTYMRVDDPDPYQEEKEMFDVSTAKSLQLIIPPIEEQSQFESRFVWRKVTEYLERNDPKSANEHQSAIKEKQKKIIECLEQSHQPWGYQLFDYNEEMKRFIPKELNLSLYQEDEEPVQMHAGFNVPQLVLNLELSGVVKTNLQIQEDTERSIHEDI
ncbi:Oxysterol-binding protein 4 [Tritrichomonas foetus]|uniref:Oxysterol-binding protein 4 n=1 Tax=Tritrichomonas foetus TaxID=1144522 RepID=A0A1J4KCK7_9EUKA|nr:Oxysterol-binding protein 4 [Tritrichomonas foetus]|eukprot:OHT08672.1 Oxysterol-binding protein 4 [Tritrichomonas foetus]